MSARDSGALVNRLAILARSVSSPSPVTLLVKMVNALNPVGKLRSDDLQGNWNTRISQNMLVVEVVSEGVRYAGAVHGGADDTMRQSAAMKRRGWLSVDEMAKKVDSKVAQSASKVVARAIADYLASRGVTAAAT